MFLLSLVLGEQGGSVLAALIALPPPSPTYYEIKSKRDCSDAFSNMLIINEKWSVFRPIEMAN